MKDILSRLSLLNLNPPTTTTPMLYLALEKALDPFHFQLL